MSIKRGDIFYADLSPTTGSEQGGVRPVLIVQNDIGNKFSPTVIAAAITSQKTRSKLPTHIHINSQESGLTKDSVVLLEQIRTIDKTRLREKTGFINNNFMSKIDNALSLSFGLRHLSK
ncbi:MAG: type II toxin-antitoxin system PemK/MazF family toxin [Candidatus Paraimprobicoccus trichonymphae]|uniref:mRNA interferase n=1 Tax=Candidatus Paraimprobicoccus trichonymphae TaxID=3033793 RepID=A0AA48KY74_9FIRM|nr:MAG: type II toxin-antitoxin system PemK/MazF family toxin [Candidatus Paraimprobicoccus trichonymphae]